ncbi:MAG: hypothetical protein JWO57_2016 [Pseudonocardiales bacterium]|nr:hypothetical protein [Pseudonocardiales bacterium]
MHSANGPTDAYAAAVATRRVVYTVLMGRYETLLEQHIAGNRGVDLVCFTDDPTAVSTTWKIRYVERAFALDPNRSSRRPKILAHEYLADYDESLYIDNSTLLLTDPDSAFDTLLPPDAAFALLRHSFRDTLADEFTAVVDERRDAAWTCEEQREHYERTHPSVLAASALWGGLLLRRHHDPAVREAMQVWWEHVLRFSRRDQLSLPVALDTAALKPLVHELDNHTSSFHEWPRGAAQRDPGGGAPLPIGPEARIAELEAQAAELRARSAEVEAQSAALRHELEAGRAEADELRGAVTELRARHDSAVSHRDRLADEVADLRESTSWRITRPLRFVRDAVSALRAARRPGA